MTEQTLSHGDAPREGGDSERAVAEGQSGTSLKRMTARMRELEGQLGAAQKATRLSRSKAGYAQWHVDPRCEPEEEGWLLTYLDTMTLLLVLLVVMLALAGKGSLEGINRPASGTSNARSGILPANDGLLPEQAMQVPTPLPKTAGENPFEGLPLDQLGDDIDVVVNDSTVSFRISSEILFSSGRADLSLAGVAVLRRLIPVLNAGRHRIAVEGHTDAVPIRSGRYPSNWELSGARAGGVVRYLEANGVASERLRAVGYADTRPLADNASAEGRASNRRVELIMEKPGS